MVPSLCPRNLSRFCKHITHMVLNIIGGRDCSLKLTACKVAPQNFSLLKSLQIADL